MTQIKFTDSVTLHDVQTHQDGYKIVKGRIARTGLQGYLRRELGDNAPMGDPNDLLQIYRPDDEVFADDALNGWTHVPVTLDHPPELVTPDNVKQYAIGEVTAKAHLDRKEGWIGLEWIVKDAASIAALDVTHKQVSGGYTADIDFTAGVTPDGKSYDGVQRAIHPNHLALVPNGRAFSDAAKPAQWGIAPQPQKDHEDMTMKTIVVGDKAVQVAAVDADVITKMIADHASVVVDLNTKVGELKAECADAAKKVLTDAQVEALVADRMAIVDKARTLVADYDAAGKAVSDVKREVVASVYGDDAASTEVSDAEINGIFRIMKPAEVSDVARDAIKDAAKNKEDMNDPWAKAQDKLKGKK
jgi:hypothetical protein